MEVAHLGNYIAMPLASGPSGGPTRAIDGCSSPWFYIRLPGVSWYNVGAFHLVLRTSMSKNCLPLPVWGCLLRSSEGRP